jgi:hypothetical protein
VANHPSPQPPAPGVSLQEFVERILAERDIRYEQRFAAQETAGVTALVAAKETLTTALTGLEKANAIAIDANRVLAAKAEEFADQKLQTHNAIKPWVQSLIDVQNEKLLALERRVSKFEDRESGITLTTKILIGAISLAATIAGLYFMFHR